MAVEVVRPGQLPTERRMAGTCDYCKCEVRCLQGDAREEASGRNETDYRVDCPTAGCGKRITPSFVKEDGR